jgi:2-oxoisovalerate dehydrogenase E1 component alpha subunit
MDTLALRSTPPLGVLRDDGSIDPAHAPALSEELAIALYEQMVVARTLDERLVALQRDGAVSQHASALGEEATVLGAAAAMSDDDWVFPSSREFAAALWRGMPIAAYAHHMFGTVRDAGKGRCSPDPPFWKAAHVVSASPLVGTQVAHAVGVAWSARMRGHDVAALVFLGEEATSCGDFHTGLNLAGVTRAPVVAVCRNNGEATRTPASRQTASAGFAIKSLAYGLDGIKVDGTDVLAVLSVVRMARERAVAGLGGTLVEAVIPGIDRIDPLSRLRVHLESNRLWSTQREHELQSEVRADVDRAIAEARAAEPPARASLFDDVYADLPWHLEEQRFAQ